MEERFASYILSNKGNIKASILLKLLKCIVVGYSNGNESFTSRLFSSYGSLNMLFHFSRYLIYSVFHETFVKMFMTKLSFSSSKFKNPFQDVVSYRRLGCLILWYWNVGPLNTEMFVSFWGCFFRNKRADILNFSWIKYLSNWFLISHKVTYMGLLLLKLRAVELESRTENRHLIANWYIF